MECPKCKGKVENKANVLLLGLIGRVAFPKYECPDCGSLKLNDFPEEERKKIIIRRTIFAVIFIGLIILVIVLSVSS